jgi:lipoprotein-releasing system ATP-binding protein
VVLEAKGLTKRFTEGRLDVTVLHGVDLQIRAGETLAIVGASGSGKSTLLHLLGGLDAPTSGGVELMGEPLHRLGPQKQGLLRNRHLGFIYQFHHLLPEFSALDNVAMPLRIRRLPYEECTRRAEQMLAQVGLADKAKNYPSQLSGGQQQRVAIARSLAMQPQLMLFDEVTSALDPQLTGEVLRVMQVLAQEGRTMLVVTHEMGFAREVAHTVAFMDQGELLETRPAAEFFGSPGHERSRAFLNHML